MKLSRNVHYQLESFFREFFADENLQLPEIEIFTNRGARLVTRLISVQGITFGRFIFIKPDLFYRDKNSNLCISKMLLAHEATHVLQYQNLGAIKFLYTYLRSFFNSLRSKKRWDFDSRMQAYLEIPFEAEARAGGADFVKWKEKVQKAKGKMQS